MMLASPGGGKDLYKAAEAGDYKKLRKVLRVEKKDIKPGQTVKVKGLDVEWRGPDGRTPLMVAASKGCDDMVEALLYCSANVHVRDKDGNMALHVACESAAETLQATDRLIASGAELDARNRAGDTALHRAAVSGKEGHCNKLLQAGANCGLYNVAGLTCIDSAAMANQSTVCSLLLAGAPRLRRSTRSLFEAVERGYVEVARALLEGGMYASPVEVDAELGDTPLHKAVRAKNLPVATLLLRHGASVVKTNTHKEAPLDLAASNQEMLLLLQNADSIEKHISATPETLIFNKAAGWDYPLLKNKQHWCAESAKHRSSSSAENGVSCLLDENPKTYYSMVMANDTENFVAFDFGRPFIIAGIRICGNASAHMVKDFTLLAADSIEGPWSVVKTLTAEQKGPDALGDLKGENQDFHGFNIQSRCIKLRVDANYGSYCTSINGVGFFGVDGSLEPWLKEFGLERLCDDFLSLKLTQVADMWMVADTDIKRLSKGDTKTTADLIAAIRAAEDRENRMTWLDYGKPPVRQHLEGKRLPDFTVLSDPGCRGEVELVFHGDPDVKGETRKQLERDPHGGPSKATFSGIVLSPPGNYIIEARSVDHPDIFVHTVEPTSISFMMKDKSEVEEAFGEMNDLLRF